MLLIPANAVMLVSGTAENLDDLASARQLSRKTLAALQSPGRASSAAVVSAWTSRVLLMSWWLGISERRPGRHRLQRPSDSIGALPSADLLGPHHLGHCFELIERRQ
jgi:hypothetical protein